MTPRLSPTELLAIMQPWTGVAEPLHRRVRQVTDATDQHETLWIGCGSGRSVLWWAEWVGAPIAGIDPDPGAIDLAERAARAAGLGRAATFAVADPEHLPHRDAVYDLVIIRMLQCGPVAGERVVRQAARVVRKGGVVAALLPTWFHPPGPRAAARIASLGILPRTLMAWKGAYRDAGLVEVEAEEAGADAGWLDGRRMATLVRAWRVARGRGVLAALGPAFRALRRLAVTRRLGLALVRGTRWPHA